MANQRAISGGFLDGDAFDVLAADSVLHRYLGVEGGGVVLGAAGSAVLVHGHDADGAGSADEGALALAGADQALRLERG